MKKLECKRCGWKWFPRIETKPVQCPKCKKLKWDEVKKYD